MAFPLAAKESIWIQRFLSELGYYTAINGNVIYGDHQGAIALANNPKYHSSSADLPFVFLRSQDYLPMAPCICNS
jgi:hypothetical protein